MSRCFPFPPPGYEKPRSEDVDLLRKEKEKKKKHKREKRDKEKQDGKERKHNDKSKDKHKEKKDRKEKHKEKRSHKERDKEKTSGRRIEERAQGQNENKVLDSCKDYGEVEDSKFTEELAKRYNGDGATNKMSENPYSSVHTSEGCRPQSSTEKERRNRMEMVVNDTSKQQTRNDGSCRYSDQKTQGNKKSKEMSLLATGILNKDNEKSDERGKPMEKELDKRNAEEHQALDKYDIDTGNGLKDQGRSNVLGQMLQKGTEKAEWKEAIDKQKMASFIVKCQTNNERLYQTFVDVAKHIEECEKPEVREVESGMPNHHIHKDREEKKRKKKDKERHKKEKEKEQRSKHKHKDKEHAKSKGIQEQHQLVTQCIATIKDDEKHADGEENWKKRKDQVKNGFFNEIGLRPNKLPRPIENGRMIESCYLPAPSPSKLGGTNINIEEHRALDKSEHTINGTLSLNLKSSVPADMSRHDGVSLKAPHPDSKYLETVYGVPKSEDRLEFDNQDWLFGSNISHLKPKADAMVDEMVPQVWSEGRKIESADVFALPYVIPY